MLGAELHLLPHPRTRFLDAFLVACLLRCWGMVREGVSGARSSPSGRGGQAQPTDRPRGSPACVPTSQLTCHSRLAFCRLWALLPPWEAGEQGWTSVYLGPVLGGAISCIWGQARDI